MISYMYVKDLLPHERVDAKRVEEIAQDMLTSSLWKEPIFIDRYSNIIMDGHHRYNAAKSLGLNSIPCVKLDYDQDVELYDWKNGQRLDVNIILQSVVDGKLLPIKTTRHVIDQKYKNIRTKININTLM
nr:hypothetical protein BCU32_03125 [Vibrio lentus]